MKVILSEILRQKIFFESVSDTAKLQNINPKELRQQIHRGSQSKERFSTGKTVTQFNTY